MECCKERTVKASIGGKICTAIFAAIWLLEFCALILAHQGISAIIPEITYLPENLVNGFQTVLGLEGLQSGMEEVQEQAEAVLQKCMIAGDPSYADKCNGYDPVADVANCGVKTVDDSAERVAVGDAFDAGLTKVMKVVTDEYFGLPGMASSADGLTMVREKFDEATASSDDSCCFRNVVYCGMREAAVQTLAGVEGVNGAIDGLAENEGMDVFANVIAPQLPLMHAVPYLFVISLALFTGFWASASSGECCKSKLGVCMYVFHFILGWVGNALAIVVVTIYLALGPGADRVNIPDGILAKDGANLQIIKDHIDAEYNELWVDLFVPFGDAGTAIGQAFMVFLAVGIFVIIYGILVCIIRPYRPKKAEPEAKEGGA